jgi:hypothetical protein
MTPLASGLKPTPKADQSSLCPSADGGWIWQARRILALRRSLFGSITNGEALACLLPTVKAVVAGRRQPTGQHGERLATWPADSTPYPNAFVLVIVALT